MNSILKIIKGITPVPLLSFYHLTLAWLASLRYGAPSQRLTIIGVTGTNGKTTAVHLLHEIFRAAGFGVGSVSSLRFKINDSETPNLLKMTMPGRFALQKFLAECVKAGCRFAVVEVTSEGVKQSRHRFISFHGGVMTNVRPEHIEAHGSFEKYRRAKIELFRRLPKDGFAVLNKEDDSAEVFASSTAAAKVWYSRSAIEVKKVGHPVNTSYPFSGGILFEIDSVPMPSRLEGEFNAMNTLAAAASAMACGVSLSAIARAVTDFRGVAGRMEYVQKVPFVVIVDYAHTPDALASVYQTLSSANPKSEIRNPKLICVLGSAGGGRDRWKRPEMGRIAARYCREVILTSEDPDDENPSRIALEMQSGIPNDKIQMTKVVIDRREAIREALKMTKPGDTVVITGMGAQPWFIVKGKKIPWDDRQIVREELAKIKNQESRIKNQGLG